MWTIVLSLYAKGMSTGKISAHFAEICGASVSREAVSRITDTAPVPPSHGCCGSCTGTRCGCCSDCG